MSRRPARSRLAAPSARPSRIATALRHTLSVSLLATAPMWAFAAETESVDAAKPQETTLKTVVVKAAGEQSATEPVTGYVAKRTASATKTDTPVVETPQAISVVTPDQIRDQGAQNVQDALRYVAGVRSEPYGLDSRGDWSMIRGAEPVVFADGLQ